MYFLGFGLSWSIYLFLFSQGQQSIVLLAGSFLFFFLLSHLLLAYKVFAEKFDDNPVEVPLCVKDPFTLAFKALSVAWHWWLTPVILSTWEAKSKRMMVQSQPRQKISETLSQKYLTQKG
jgi:hypothetical protein